MLQLDSYLPLTATQDGVLRITGTRVGLDAVVELFDEGASPEEIAEEFDTLSLADVYAVIAYYLRHRTEVHGYLTKLHEKSEAVGKQVEAQFHSSPLRQRLLALKREREQGGS